MSVLIWFQGYSTFSARIYEIVHVCVIKESNCAKITCIKSLEILLTTKSHIVLVINIFPSKLFP